MKDEKFPKTLARGGNKMKTFQTGEPREVSITDIETETVSSVPAISLKGNIGHRACGTTRPEGNIELKPDKASSFHPGARENRHRHCPQDFDGRSHHSQRGPTRWYRPHHHAATEPSKAGAFESKVSNALGQGDSSDSDESFVYGGSEPYERKISQHHVQRSRGNSTTAQGGRKL